MKDRKDQYKELSIEIKKIQNVRLRGMNTSRQQTQTQPSQYKRKPHASCIN